MHTSRAPSRRALPPHSQAPAGHRWLIAIGLGCFVLWATASALAQQTATDNPHFAATTEQVGSFLGLLAVAFLAVGLSCEIILAWIISSRLKQQEQDLLADLSGRTRFSKPREKSKLIITDDLPEGLTPEELELAGYRKVLLKRTKSPASDPW